MRTVLLVSAMLFASSCTGPLNQQTMKDMPSSFLCRILGPDYLSLPSEQLAIYKELERRGEQCIDTNRVIIEKR